jgi:hypothetical protein
MDRTQRTPLARRTLTISATVLGISLAGCGSLVTRKFDSAPTSPSNDIGGIPFTLNKPQFTVTRTPAAPGAIDSYQMRIDYIADPTQRYVVQLKPNITAGVDWTVQLDDGGSLSDSNAKMTDNSVAIIGSVVKLAVAAAALDSYQTPEPEQATLINDALKADLEGSTPKVYDRADPGLLPVTHAEANRVLDRWQHRKPEFDRLATENQLASFTYADELDRVVLDTALHLFPAQLPATSVIQEAIDGLDPDLGPFAQRVKNAMVRFDRRLLQTLKADLVKERSQIYARIGFATQDPNAPALLNKNKSKLNVVAEGLFVLKTPPRELLLDLTDLTQSDWQRRTLVRLNKEIDTRRSIDRGLIAPPGKYVELNDPELQELLRRKAIVLGLLPEFAQLAVLRAIPVTDPDKYSKAQAAAAGLQKVLSDTEAALTPAAPTIKTDDPSVASLLLNSRCEEVTPQWINAKLTDQKVPGRPAYLVVLQPGPANSPACLPAAAPPVAPPAAPQPLPQQPVAPVSLAPAPAALSPAAPAAQQQGASS